MTIRKRTDSGDRKKLLTNQDSGDFHENHEASDLTGDYGNIAILFFLYLLQGIPLGEQKCLGGGVVKRFVELRALSAVILGP